MKKTKKISCDCGNEFDYEAKDLFMKPLSHVLNILGDELPKDNVNAVCCPKCGAEILTHDKLNIVGDFLG